VSKDETKNMDIVASIDFLPNLVRLGQTKIVEDFLRKKFENRLPGKIARYGEVPYLIVRLGPFDSLIREARDLYVDEYYEAAVALSGMTAESLCITIAEERVKDELLKKQLTDPSMDCRKKIEPLKKYLRIAKSASLLHQVLDIRKEYLHLHKTRVLPEEVLKCINTLHLAVIAEYGLVPAEEGKVRFATKEDIEQLAKKMGIRL
jgi:hypothetical protein